MSGKKKVIFVLDRYTCKNFRLEVDLHEEFSLGEKIVIRTESGKGDMLSIAEYIGEKYFSIDREASFERRLTDQESKEFERAQRHALEKFPLFKRLFLHHFPSARAVTARYHTLSRQFYFYFFSEERLDFKAFIQEFRTHLSEKFFFYQIDSRTMIKLSPATDVMLEDDGRMLAYKTYLPFPTISPEDLSLQHLEGRDLERLRDLSGKLKPSLAYEVDTYIQESKTFPKKGSAIVLHGYEGECIVMDFNIISRQIILKTEDDTRIIMTREELAKSHPHLFDDKDHAIS